MKAINN